jgi:hypothetical protein
VGRLASRYRGVIWLSFDSGHADQSRDGRDMPSSEVTSITRSETRNRDCELKVTFVRFSPVSILGEPSNPPQTPLHAPAFDTVVSSENR